ncbi:MAG: toxin-antitoxin system HicB family antitoxin [Chloroflexia bacterium]|jgi:predicted HicB family RNase H-like nuclease|nr:toxin-antitoxin system HicB family antitoxin [Chloroflexia bacterium]
MNPHDYNITVRRVGTDDGPSFEARIRELPDVAEYAETFNDAYELAIDTIETTAEAFAEAGRAMPTPATPVEDYSGRITVRVPKTLHRDLALAAEEEGVSLNLLISNALAHSVGARLQSRVRTTSQRF